MNHIRYIGAKQPNCDYFHGQIPYVKGAKLYQVARAGRGVNEGHTYQHAPDLAWYHGRFYIAYLTNPQDEHGGAGVTRLAYSEDGRKWESTLAFPVYMIPEGEVTNAKGEHLIFDGKTPAFMHQRMAFYCAKNDVMLVSGFYGWSPVLWQTNWDHRGLGRVVRRLYPDGSLGDIYFILINHQGGWQPHQLIYPEYQESEDQAFVEACEELLHNTLVMQEWAEESGDSHESIRIKHPQNGTYQAFCWYHRTEQDVIGLWKHSFVARSLDGGITWDGPIKEPSLIMSGQKIWGEKTADGRYALVYDPTLETQHRFPLCLVTSEDGLDFDDMRLIHGEVPPMRYKGFSKDLGPQYMRGISEGMPKPEDQNLSITYSVNKEDIWFAQIPVPIQNEEIKPVCERHFDEAVLRNWNLYQPSWASIQARLDGSLELRCSEPYDYARAVRLLPSSSQLKLRLALAVGELSEDGTMQLELNNAEHKTAIRLIWRPEGKQNHRTVCELGLSEWKPGRRQEVLIEADCQTFSYQVTIDGQEMGPFRFMAAVDSLSEVSIRTGEPRYLANIEENPDNKPESPLPGCESPKAPVCVRLHEIEMLTDAQ